MSTEKTLALVIRLVDFSETSAVVTLYTRDFGKIGALAKGAKRPKGPFESALDLLAMCRIVFIRKSSDALDLLTEAKLERRFRGRPRAMAGYYAGYYVAELLDALTDQYEPHPELFDLADVTLEHIGGDASLAWTILRFELSALRALGHLPELEQCAECGASLETSTRVYFGLLDGGVLCAACRPGKRSVISLRPEAIAIATQLADWNDSHWMSLTVPRAVYGEVRGLVTQYITHLVGRELRLHRFLGQLAPPDGKDAGTCETESSAPGA